MALRFEDYRGVCGFEICEDYRAGAGTMVKIFHDTSHLLLFCALFLVVTRCAPKQMQTAMHRRDALSIDDHSHMVLLDTTLPPPSPTSLEHCCGITFHPPTFGDLAPVLEEDPEAHSLLAAAVEVHQWFVWRRLELPLTALGDNDLSIKKVMPQILFARAKLSNQVSPTHVLDTITKHLPPSLPHGRGRIIATCLRLCQTRCGEASAIGLAVWWAMATMAESLCVHVLPHIRAMQRRARRSLASVTALREVWRRRDAARPPFCMVCGDGSFTAENPLLMCDGCSVHPSHVRQSFAAVHLLCEKLTWAQARREPFFCRRFCRQLNKLERRKLNAAHAKHLKTPPLLMSPCALAADLINLVEQGGGGAISTIGDPLIADFCL